MTDAQVKRAARSDELARVNHFLCQLNERHNRAVVDHNGKPVFGPPEIAQIEAVIGQAELEVGKLHMLAATSREMIDECRAAFDLPPTKRSFEVLSDNDAAPTPKPSHKGGHAGPPRPAGGAG